MFAVRIYMDQQNDYLIEEGVDILTSMRNCGNDPIGDCGGKGECGKCRARLVDGRLSPLTEHEQAVLTPMEISTGWFLMCERQPLTDLIIDMPQRDRPSFCTESSELTAELVPAVRKCVVDLRELADGETTDYQSLLLESLSEQGVEQISLLAYSQLMPALAAGDGVLTALVSDQVLRIEAGDTSDALLGAAVDLGTASIGLRLYDLAKRQLIGSAVCGNPHRSFGSALRDRVEYAHTKQVADLQKVLVGAVNRLLQELCARLERQLTDVQTVTFAGSTEITHMLLGIVPPNEFELPAFLEMPSVFAAELGLEIYPQAPVSVLPCLSREIGSDTAALLPMLKQNDSLLIDLGATTKLLYKHDGAELIRQVATPVLDGLTLRGGMLDGEGSITGFDYNEELQDLRATWQGNDLAKGFSGAGILKAVADLQRLGYVDAEGCFVQEQLPEKVAKRLRDTAEGREMLVAGGGYQSVLLPERDVQETLRETAALRQALSEFLSGHRVVQLIVTGPAGAAFTPELLQLYGLLPEDCEAVEYQPDLVLQAAADVLLYGGLD